ncbi:MAG: HAD-IA family hydrolase [Candidatus Binatia bacterium]
MIPRPQLLVCDMIGTTVAATDAVPDAFALALAPEGVAVGPAALAGVRGLNKRDAIAQLVPPGSDHEARAAAAYRRFTTALSDAYARPGAVRALDGAADVVRRCRAAGLRVVLTTGFDRAMAALLLRVLDWAAHADGVVCGDEVARGRPAPCLIERAMQMTGVTDPVRVAVVGDTVADLEAGRNAGAGWNIGVWSGAHDRTRLAAAPHTHLCASIADVPALLGLP